MASITIEQAGARTRWFYVWMAGVCVAVAFGLFAPTYWLQLPAGTFTGSPLLHLHAILFSAWPLFFLSQTTLAAIGRLDRHRAWGLLGIALATAMTLVGIATANEVLTRRLAAGFGDPARAFAIIPISGAVLFGALVATAIANVTRPEVHKRLMLLASLSILQAAVARVFFALNVGMGPGVRPGMGPPLSVESSLGAAFFVDLLILAAIVYDWRARGRPHPVYLIGGAIVVGVQLLRVPVSHTEAWYAIADVMASFGTTP